MAQCEIAFLLYSIFKFSHFQIFKLANEHPSFIQIHHCFCF